MGDPAVLLEVESWPQAMVYVAFLGAFVIWPGVLAWLTAKKNKVSTDQINEKTDTIKATLTENNGGSHVKDKLDKIVEAVEGLQEWKDEHMAWSSDTMEKLNVRLSGVDEIGRNNTALLEQLLETATNPRED